jgi:energy-coupling factor transporter ATP-binding protein EcfA2
MIRSIHIHHPEKTHTPWMGTIPALAKPRKFEFTPGLNILWGENGSGKSTLIKAMARLLHCEQGGVPTMTQTSLSSLLGEFSFLGSAQKKGEALRDFQSSLTLDYDGQPVRSFDSSKEVGLMGGSFDGDFMMQGVANTLSKASAGQTTMRRANDLVGDILERKVPVFERKISADRVNTVWQERIAIADEFLKWSGEKGPLTVLMDEPERSFDFPNQVMMWRFIRSFSSEVQFIVASHSFYALGIKEANYIEMTPGYLAKAEKCLNILKSWGEEVPAPPKP